MNRNNILDYTNQKPAPSDSLGFRADLIGHIKTSVIATIVLGIIVSGAYPLIVWGLAQAMFHDRANGSLIGKDGKPVSKDADAVGSSLIGQAFSPPQYFHPRPSAAGNGYDATASSGSNLGPTSGKLLLGDTPKNVALTVFAADKSHSPVVPIAGRVQATVAAVTKTTITVTMATDAKAPKTTYALDPAVADPNTVVAYHGRTIHATTIAPGSIVELKLSGKTPPVVTAINVVDQEIDGAASAPADMTANKFTMADASGTVINFDPKNTVFVVNGKADAKARDITTAMTLHAVVSLQMDYDGIADRVIHYCQDNSIAYKSSIPDSAFMDADGLDDAKLIMAFNASATPPTIDPATAIPADAVTASGSGLDPHISVANANLQAKRVADARHVSLDKVKGMIAQYTEGPNLGFLGDAGVNVLRLNVAVDNEAPMPAAAPTTAPATQP